MPLSTPGTRSPMVFTRLARPFSSAERFAFFFQAEDGIRDGRVTGVQTCALPISVDDGIERQARHAVGRTRRLRYRPDLLGRTGHQRPAFVLSIDSSGHAADSVRLHRSEERRVGKECRSRWWPYQKQKKIDKIANK